MSANAKGTVVLLAGVGSNRLGWYGQLEVFGRTYRTIALDYRDVGDSDPMSEPYTLADLADDAAAVLSTLGVQRAHVVGIAMGGFVALQVAMRHPDLVEKLVLVATSAGGSTHVPPNPEMMALLGQPDLQLEAGERRRRTYARIAAPGYFESHPADWDRVADNARHRPQRQESYFRQLQAGLGKHVTRALPSHQPPSPAL